MENLEIAAKTVEEATEKALKQLGVSRDKVEITVLSEGKSGIFGLGAEEARISVKVIFPEGGQDANSATAGEVIETLLKKMGVDARVVPHAHDFSSEQEGESSPLAFDIKGDDLGILIGRRGQTLACLQYIVRLIISQKVKSWVPVVIDVDGYKERRYEALNALAIQVAEQVRSKKTSFKLEPMPAYERRIIHLALAKSSDVTTQSIGEGEERKVVILPKKK